MASSLDRWEKDPFFNAAEEVQESTDRMECTYRTWIHATKDKSSKWNIDELRRDLVTALSTAKWQLEEFGREVSSSYSRSSSEEARSRHRDFITAIEDKITKVEHSLSESQLVPPGKKSSMPWVYLDEGEKHELAMFLSGMPAIVNKNPTWTNTEDTENPGLCDEDSIINSSKKFHVTSELGQAKEETPRGHRRAASASADIGHWKISVSDDAQQSSLSSDSSGPMHKVPSLSGFLSSVESISKLKWPRSGYRKLKAFDHNKETDSALLPTAELSRGNKALCERSKSNLNSSEESYDKQLYGWGGAIQRQLRRSQYQMQYSQPVRIAVLIVFLLCLIDQSACSWRQYLCDRHVFYSSS